MKTDNKSMRKYINSEVKKFRRSLINELMSKFAGKKVRIMGFIGGTTGWEETTIGKVVDIDISSCYDVYFNGMAHHGDYSVIIIK